MRIDVTMGNPRAVEITKAGVISEKQPVKDVIITISGAPDDSLSLTAAREFYEHEAATLFDALSTSLPGGTLDELLVLLMKKRASLFRIPLFEEEQ